MLRKKVCVLGSVAGGKTSLVRRFVERAFSDRYNTTVGVRIDKKVTRCLGQEINLALWDFAGEDEFAWAQTSYLRDSHGFLLVVDGTRRTTFDAAARMRERLLAQVGPLPTVVVLNKQDVQDQWEVDAAAIAALTADGCHVVLSSAKLGQGVEEAFTKVTELALARL